jgi:hypothetical protein
MKSQTTPHALHLVASIFVTGFFIAAPAHADTVVSSDPTSNMSCSSGVCTPTAASAVLNVDDLQAMLASGNVKLAASGEPVDVDINAALTWVSTNTLTLDSHHSINVTQPVAITGGGGLALLTNDGGTGGVFGFTPGANVSFWSLSSSLTIDGVAYTLVGNIATLASDIATNTNGTYALASNYNAAPDGTYSSSPITTEFSGTFQGLGNTISNLSVANKAKGIGNGEGAGLFLLNGATGIIANINMQSISIAGNGKAGGIAAGNKGLLFDDHVAGTIAGGKSTAGGGLIGLTYAGSAATASSSSALVTSGKNSTVGGLVGSNSGTISSCYATGTTMAYEVGGLAGFDDSGTITDSYATGSVKGEDAGFVGGLVGLFENGTVGAAYSTGSVKGHSNTLVGGFLGQFDGGTASNSYWDTKTSKSKNASGNEKNVSGVTGETTAQLQSGLPAGFDPTIWAENPSINNGLPYLIANPPQ